MPRPQRIREREHAIAGVTEPEDLTAEVVEAPPEPLTRKDEIAQRRTLRFSAVPEEGVDNSEQERQSVRTGLVAEGEKDLAESVAKRMGWLPPDEWKRDPAKHVDALTFLERTPREVETLKDRLKRMSQVSEEQAELARREALEQARAEHEAAVKTGDVDAAGRAVEKIAKASGPHPQTVAWLAKNPWFQLDPDAQALAASAMRRAEMAGGAIDMQLQAGEAAVRKRFPEHFEDVEAPIVRREAPKEEVRLSEIRTPPPAMAPGSRGAGVRPVTKEKGWMDIPAGDRSAMQQFVRKAQRRGLTEAEATGRLARTYWETKAS